MPKLLSQEEKERKLRCVGEGQEQHFQEHLQITPRRLKNQRYEKRQQAYETDPVNA